VRDGCWRSTRIATRLLLALSSLLLIGVAPSGADTMPTSTLRCGFDHLSVLWRGTTGGLAGTFGELFWIRHEGGAACVVSGYPSISFYENGKRLLMKTEDFAGHLGNDMMGIASGRRIPSIRLSPGGIASFWIFGNDVMPKCINASQIVMSVKSLAGRAVIPVPRVYSAWIYCGGGIGVNPMVAGVSGSDPPRPLRSELLL